MKKIESIQGFRAVAFLIIFLSHSGAIWHELGGWSVSFFIVLSGFLAFYTAYGKTTDYSAKGCVRYEWKRVSRMYPLHLIMLLPALAIQMALIVVGRDVFNAHKILSALIPNLLLIHCILRRPTVAGAVINGS